MLTREDNELLCRVGPGTPMGVLMRHYWLPVLYSSDLGADGPPQRVRLLGEDLVAWRNTDGSTGLMRDACPHRGASMFFGRNEENGLRCVYHGWKFDAGGACTDMPNEPAESNFKHKIRATAYPTQEHGGIVWCHLGAATPPPPFPHLEWATLPHEQVRHAWRAIRECNWVQNMEGDLDTSHAYFLHSRLRAEDPNTVGLYHPDRAPRLEVLDTDYGVMYASQRTEGDDAYYWRTTQFLFPCFTMFPASPEGIVPGHMWVPMDDETTIIWCFAFSPLRPFTPQERDGYAINGDANEVWKPNAGPGEVRPNLQGVPYVNAWPVLNRRNEYGIDRQTQRSRNYTGIPTIPLQDGAMTETMGAIVDRSKEHVGSADGMMIRVRRRLIRAAKALRDAGTPPPGMGQPEIFRVRSCSAVLHKDWSWTERLRDWHAGRGGAPHRLLERDRAGRD